MSISADTLRAACLEAKFARQLSRPDIFPTLEQWDYITEHYMASLAPGLYRKYLMAWLTLGQERTDYHVDAVDGFGKYAETIGSDPATRHRIINAVYDDIDTAPEATLSIIDNALLFDAPALIALLDSTETAGYHKDNAEYDAYSIISFVISALNAYQPEYTALDLSNMEHLYQALSELEPLGEIKTVRNVFREEKRYICPEGHSNPITQEFCATPGCGLNIYGLTADQVEAIEDFYSKIQVLKKLL